jgi:hypothetical protein
MMESKVMDSGLFIDLGIGMRFQLG